MGRDYIGNVSHFVVSVKCFLNISKIFFYCQRAVFFFAITMGTTSPYIFSLIYIFSLLPLFALRFKKSKIFLHSCHCLLSFFLTSDTLYITVGAFWSKAEFPPQREREKLIYRSVLLSLGFHIQLLSLIPAPD